MLPEPFNKRPGVDIADKMSRDGLGRERRDYKSKRVVERVVSASMWSSLEVSGETKHCKSIMIMCNMKQTCDIM